MHVKCQHILVSLTKDLTFQLQWFIDDCLTRHVGYIPSHWLNLPQVIRAPLSHIYLADINNTPFTDFSIPQEMIQILVAFCQDQMVPQQLPLSIRFCKMCIFIIVSGHGLVPFGLTRFKILRRHSNVFTGIFPAVDMTSSMSFIKIVFQSINPALFQVLHFFQLRTTLTNSNLLGLNFYCWVSIEYCLKIPKLLARNNLYIDSMTFSWNR